MDWEQRCIRLCAGVLVCAVLLRLVVSGGLVPLGQALENRSAASFLLYLHTGRVVRFAAAAEPSEAQEQPAQTEPVPAGLDFSATDASDIGFTYNCDLRPDTQALLQEPVDLELTGEGPKVLILHTHTTESYTEAAGAEYEQTSPYRTLDPEHNMLVLGKLVADALTEAGIGVIHDTTFHDYPSYNGAYNHAAAATRDYLARYPTIELVLDLHRDAAETDSGQMATRCTVGGESAAQLMFVLGTNARLEHPGWEENLSLALKLQVLLEKQNPGICRSINLTSNRYNQHLGKYALLVEIGAAGNTLEQAKLAARALAEAVITLAEGI